MSSFLQAFSNPAQVTGTPSVSVTGITAGSTLVITVSAPNDTRSISSMSGGGNTYAETHAWFSVGGGTGMGVYYAYNVAAGSYTVTATMSGSETYNMSVVEIGGVTTTDPKDQAPAIEGVVTATTLDVGPTGTTAQANEMLVGIAQASASDRPFNAMTGWTNRVNITNPYHQVWTKTVSSTGTYSLPLDTSPDNQIMVGAILTLKDTSTPPASTPAMIVFRKA